MKKITLFLVAVSFGIETSAQNIGIGTSIPLARLHVIDSNVVFSAMADLPVTTGLPPISGAGRRMMWYANKAAFRAGYVSGNNWNIDSVGNYSAALGRNVKAKGTYSFAAGSGSQALGNYSVAMGSSSVADGIFSIAIGNTSNAMGDESVALGHSNDANGMFSTAWGSSSTANGHTSTSSGYFTQANGNYSTVMGRSTYANGYGSLTIGLYNDSIVDRNSSSTTTPLFIIGNGNDVIDRNNAMVVRKDGRVGIGTNTPLTTLHIKQVGLSGGLMLENITNGNKWRIFSASSDNNLSFYNNSNTEIADINDATGTYSALSDRRFKKDIEPLESILPLLLNLKPSYYHFNWQAPDEKKEIGMLAQETQKLFPSLVSYDAKKDLYKMNYAGFSTVAIKAIQEQQIIIDKQSERIDKLQHTIDALIKRNEMLDNPIIQKRFFK